MVLLRSLLRTYQHEFNKDPPRNLEILVRQVLLKGLHPESVAFVNELCRVHPELTA